MPNADLPTPEYQAGAPVPALPAQHERGRRPLRRRFPRGRSAARVASRGLRSALHHSLADGQPPARHRLPLAQSGDLHRRERCGNRAACGPVPAGAARRRVRPGGDGLPVASHILRGRARPRDAAPVPLHARRRRGHRQPSRAPAAPPTPPRAASAGSRAATASARNSCRAVAPSPATVEFEVPDLRRVGRSWRRRLLQGDAAPDV